MADLTEEQRAVCERHKVDFVPTLPDAIVGVADNVGSGLVPLNGLRHRPSETSGWFIWAGAELSDAPDFFKPMHARHLADRCPEATPMLGLAPGSRFLLAPQHEDVWFDATLLDHDV
jgi:hypothetical protein